MEIDLKPDKIKLIAWFCNKCGEKGFLEQRAQQNDYSVGVLCFEHHSHKSPDCKDASFNFTEVQE